MHPRFGSSPCIESEWGQAYFKKLYNLYESSGLGVFEQMDLILEIGAIPPITPGIIMKKTHNGISLNGSLIFTNGAVKREST
jgi:hypothetical protein